MAEHTEGNGATPNATEGQGRFAGLGSRFKRKEAAEVGAQTQHRSRKERFVRGLKSAFGIDRLLGMAMLVAFLGLYYWNPYPVQFFRDKTFDIYQRIQPREIPPANKQYVSIVDLDEDSLTVIGQWPWPRNVIADMIDKLMKMGAILVAFDVVFPEPDRMNPSVIADKLAGLSENARQQLRLLPSNDEILAQVVKNSRVVLGQAGYWDELERVEQPPIKRTVSILGSKPDRFLPVLKTMIRNVPVFEKEASGHGIFSLTPELDGIVRRVPALFMFDGDYYPALSVEMLRVATQRQNIAIRTNQLGVQNIGVAPKLVLPTDRNGRIYPYFSKSDKSKYVPAKDILDGTAPIDKIRNKMVIVGTSAVGLLDIRSIPTEDFIPGVEVHAQVIENALNRTSLIRPNYADGMEMSFTFFVGILMIWLVPAFGARWTMFLFLIIAAGAAGGSWYTFIELGLLFDAGFAIVAILLMYTLLTYTSYAKEERSRRQVRDAFSHYLSPAMVERLAEDPAALKLGGDKRNMTMLFCDVRGFTSISERYDAVGLTQLINKLLTPLTTVILGNHGTVDKYMGDCIMAFWNAPMDDPAHARHACQTALLMHEAMIPFNERLKVEQAEEDGDDPQPFRPLQVGIGLNTGDVVVGNMGSDQRFDYSVLGDSVNLAARLEGQSKTYGASIVIGEDTRQQVPEMASLELDLLQVKGKTEAVRVFALLGDEEHANGNAYIALKSANDEMLAAYRAQDWQGTRKAIETCRAVMDGHDIGELYDLYEERVAEFEITPPPPDWDGVFVAETK